MFILLYHQINSIPAKLDPLRLAVSPMKFEAQMNYLYRNGFTCVSLLSIARARMRNDPIPPRTFAITFDDGYLDNYENAFPVLQKYGFTATIFLVSDLVGKHTRWEGLSGEQAFPLMTWHSVREMQAAGFDFGSHTRTHAPLMKLDRENLIRELSTSKQMIEFEIGAPVELFFPYEKSTPELAQEVERQSYLAACGSLLLPESRYNLWRNQCFGDDTLAEFWLKTSPVWRQLNIFKYHTKVGNGVRSTARLARQFLRK
jgi:peptidoglycan/xylan/chitin deacetylase (PgdA/CDA1 family)